MCFVSTVNPSFIVLAIKQNRVQIFCYELIGSEVSVTKTEFEKQ